MQRTAQSGRFTHVVVAPIERKDRTDRVPPFCTVCLYFIINYISINITRNTTRNTTQNITRHFTKSVYTRVYEASEAGSNPVYRSLFLPRNIKAFGHFTYGFYVLYHV